MDTVRLCVFAVTNVGEWLIERANGFLVNDPLTYPIDDSRDVAFS